VGLGNQRTKVTEEQVIEPGYRGYKDAELSMELSKPDAWKWMDCISKPVHPFYQRNVRPSTFGTGSLSYGLFQSFKTFPPASETILESNSFARKGYPKLTRHSSSEIRASLTSRARDPQITYRSLSTNVMTT
jgi:hypothetical protein